jgi:hypothetical protein
MRALVPNSTPHSAAPAAAASSAGGCAMAAAAAAGTIMALTRTVLPVNLEWLLSKRTVTAP